MRSRINNSLLILLLIILWFPCLAQVADTSSKPLPVAPLPDSLSNRDAVVMMEKVEIVYRVSKYKEYMEMPVRTESIHKQIRILTKKGLDDYTIVTIPKTRYTEIDILNVFLIKPGGVVVKETATMHEVRDPGSDAELQSGELRFSIPGAEVGDVVDFSIKLTNPAGGGYPVDMFFHDEIPILNSTTTLRFKKTIRFKIQGYNGLEISGSEGKGGDSLFTWEFAYIPAILGKENGIRENELPFCRYMLTAGHYSSGLRRFDKFGYESWGAVFEPTVRGISRPNPKAKKSEYFNELMARLLKGCDTCSKFTGFCKVYNYISDSIKITEWTKPENYSSGYYLWNRSIDRFSLFILYKDLFRYFDFQGYFVFACNRFKGMVDVNWVNRDFYTQLWLAFKDEKGTLHFLLPGTANEKHMIDEIDPVLMGTKAFLVNADNAFDFSEIFLPATGYEINTRQLNSIAIVDNELLNLSVTDSYKGCFSSMVRAKQDQSGNDSVLSVMKKNLEKELPDFIIDSLVTTTPDPLPPFTYSLRYSGTQTGRIISIDDSICTIGLTEWLTHSTISTDLESRNLDYYISYPYTEKFKSTYIFPGAVELLNEKPLTAGYDNDFGSYSIRVQQLSANSISVESVYCIKSAYIPATKYLLLKEINRRQQQAKDSKLVIRKMYK